MPNQYTTGTAVPKPIEQRFWPKVDRLGPIPAHMPHLGPCWIWTASVNSSGYGQIGVGRRGEGYVLAHCLSWEMHVGPIPEGMLVLHHCDTPACVRPGHLFLGTQADNMADCAEKQRTTLGERSIHAKLTDGLVREIKRRYAAGEGNQYELADWAGVTQSSIGRIVRGETWRHIT